MYISIVSGRGQSEKKNDMTASERWDHVIVSARAGRSASVAGMMVKELMRLSMFAWFLVEAE